MGSGKFVFFRYKTILDSFYEAAVICGAIAYLLNAGQVLGALYMAEDTVVNLEIFGNVPGMRQMILTGLALNVLPQFFFVVVMKGKNHNHRHEHRQHCNCQYVLQRPFHRQ